MDISELTKTKVLLYRLLLRKGTRYLTTSDVDLMYILSKDEEVRQFLDKAKERT